MAPILHIPFESLKEVDRFHIQFSFKIRHHFPECPPDPESLGFDFGLGNMAIIPMFHASLLDSHQGSECGLMKAVH